MKITVIPLDSRPCNYSWLKKFSGFANIEIAIIPYKSTGNLHQAFSFEDYKDWLVENAKDSDFLILSIDAMVSGGLIQARKAMMDMELALANLDFLQELKKVNPKLKIYAFDTIMRTSITTSDKFTRVYWEKMNEYSKLLGDLYFNEDQLTKKRLRELENEIPKEIIETYLLARDKKHRINLYLCELVKLNIIDELLLLQEDSMSGGIQRVESTKINGFIKSHGLENLISLYNGTDEGTLVLFGKILLGLKKLKPKTYVLLSDERIKDKVMPFEDRPLEENYLNLMNVTGLEYSSFDVSEYVLAIYSEANNNYDLDLESTKEIKPESGLKYNTFVNKVNEAINSGKQVQLVDLLHPNGGSKVLINSIDYQNLLGYSAWNTASNSLGSALATIALKAYNNPDIKSFLYERIIDDCLYQTYIRRELNVKLLEQFVNVYDMTFEKSKEVLGITKRNLDVLVKDLFKVDYKITFPWLRTFEIDIDLE